MSVRIYLAARYSRRAEMQTYAEDLIAAGCTITSRWIYGSHQISDEGLSLEATAIDRRRFAEEDYADLISADICISFTEPPRSTNSRGGRHVELGIALGTGKQCIVVGHRENVFHCLPDVAFYATWVEARTALHVLAGE